MPTARDLDGYRRRLRGLEAAEVLAAERVHRQQQLARDLQALRDGPPLDWMHPVRCRDGVVRYVLIDWQPWMGLKAQLIALIDAAEDAGHGIAPLGVNPAHRLAALNMEIAHRLCAGPEGAAWVQRLADAAQAADSRKAVSADPDATQE